MTDGVSAEQHPFDLLLQMEARLRAVRQDRANNRAEIWGGLGFRLQDHWLMVPRDEVMEVMAPPELTRVPNAPQWLRGVANLRGQLLTVLDLRAALGLPLVEPLRSARILVLNAPRLSVGFWVDEVLGHREFDPQDQRESTFDEPAAWQAGLLGALEREGRLWRVFSLHKFALDQSWQRAVA